LKIKYSGLAAICLGIFSGQIHAQDQTYTFESIGPETASTQVFGINERGNLAGNTFGDPNNDGFSFYYRYKKKKFTEVGPVPDALSTSVVGISNSNMLVGNVVLEDPGAPLGQTTSGLILDKKGDFLLFDHPDAVGSTQARSVNAKGFVTGMRNSDDPEVNSSAFIYDPVTEIFTDIVPSISTIAQGINSKGEVVGSAVFSDFFGPANPCPTPSGFAQVGWFRAVDGAVTYFTVEGLGTRARDITDPGKIAGWFVDTDSTVKGFVAELDGSQCQSLSRDEIDVVQFADAEVTYVQGITNSGVLSGTYQENSGSSLAGFVATPD